MNLGRSLLRLEGRIELFFRAGGSSQTQSTQSAGFAAIAGVRFGFGLERPRRPFDDAPAPMGELGTAQRFSAALRW